MPRRQSVTYLILLAVSPATLLLIWESLKLSWLFAVACYLVIVITFGLFHIKQWTSLKAWIFGATFLEVGLSFPLALFLGWYTTPSSAQIGSGAVYVVLGIGVLLLGIPGFFLHNLLVWKLGVKPFLKQT